LYSSPDIINIIRQIKSRRMGWAGHVARMGKDRKLYKFFVGKPEDVIMGLECILGRLDERMLSRFSWLRIGASVGLL
jgi:hypothetical protein